MTEPFGDGRRGRILLLESEDEEAVRLTTDLNLEGYEVEWLTDGMAGLERVRSPELDLVILELKLPGLDGYRLLRCLRRRGSAIPALVLSRHDSESEKVLGLQSGADDYVTKPYGTRELMARVEALLRRARNPSGGPFRRRDDPQERETVGACLEDEEPDPVMEERGMAGFAAFPQNPGTPSGKGGGGGPGDRPPVISFSDIQVDPSTHVVRKGGEEVDLTPKEFELLLALARRRGAVASRPELLEEVWNPRTPITSRTVDTHLFELRRKLEDDPSNPRHLLTVRKVGYRLQPR
jgi:two-component system, OmpR family, alkaline phosphatase synthesis response regulator PhoP